MHWAVRGVGSTALLPRGQWRTAGLNSGDPGDPGFPAGLLGATSVCCLESKTWCPAGPSVSQVRHQGRRLGSASSLSLSLPPHCLSCLPTQIRCRLFGCLLQQRWAGPTTLGRQGWCNQLWCPAEPRQSLWASSHPFLSEEPFLAQQWTQPSAPSDCHMQRLSPDTEYFHNLSASTTSPTIS